MQVVPPSVLTTPVLDHGFVALESHAGGDLSVINSARVSYAVRHENIEEGDAELINYLLKHKHGSPFEHNLFTFNVKLPLFVAREWIRHRIGSFNEVSMRYTKIEPEFYVPRVENVRERVGKPGAYTYQPMGMMRAYGFMDRLAMKSAEAGREYQQALDDGVAPELARLFLPVNVYTQWWWTVNARSLMNFLYLRNSDKAQWEIMVYARAIEEMFGMEMPLTKKAFVANERVAP